MKGCCLQLWAPWRQSMCRHTQGTQGSSDLRPIQFRSTCTNIVLERKPFPSHCRCMRCSRSPGMMMPPSAGLSMLPDLLTLVVRSFESTRQRNNSTVYVSDLPERDKRDSCIGRNPKHTKVTRFVSGHPKVQQTYTRLVLNSEYLTRTIGVCVCMYVCMYVCM